MRGIGKVDPEPILEHVLHEGRGLSGLITTDTFFPGLRDTDRTEPRVVVRSVALGQPAQVLILGCHLPAVSPWPVT